MTTLLTTPAEITTGGPGWSPDEAQLAAAAFLARYLDRDRTLEAYRYDLRSLSQWADDHGLNVLAATRAHLEWYRTAMNNAGMRRRRSIVGCARCAATTASLTSTAAGRFSICVWPVGGADGQGPRVAAGRTTMPSGRV